MSSSKSHYDYSCATFNPKGKLFQVEYAQEAVKKGSICLGLKNKTHAVLVSLKRQESELAGFFEKVFKVDDNIGMGIAGLTADARILCKYMRNECLNHRYVYDSEHPLNRLVQKVAEKSQAKTQQHHKRPYGVGLLIAGHDQDGPHVVYADPSGNYYEFHAYAIGSRCQSGRTYFEEHYETFENASVNELVQHGVKALKKATAESDTLTNQNIEISIVGLNTPFRNYTPEELQNELNQLPQDNQNQMEEEN